MVLNLFDKIFPRDREDEGDYGDYGEYDDYGRQGNDPAPLPRQQSAPSMSSPRFRQESAHRSPNVIDMNSSQARRSDHEVVVMSPYDLPNACVLCDYVKSGRTVVCNFENIRKETAVRALDFIMGAVYALQGTIKQVSDCIYVATPANTKLTFNEREQRRPERGPQFQREQGASNSRRLFTTPPAMNQDFPQFVSEMGNTANG